MTNELKYRVTRFCCRSGLCFDCHQRSNHGNLHKRERVVQADNLSKELAQRYVAGWSDYDAIAEPMDVPAGFGVSALLAKG